MMSIQSSNNSTRLSRPLPLAACLAAILGASLSSASQNPEPGQPAEVKQHAASTSAERPQYPSAMTHFVDTCLDDNSPNSLRTLIGSANDGDTIDFSQLPMTCSKITLNSSHVPPHLEITQPNLYLNGPGQSALTIDGNFESSVLRHTGTGTLHITGLTIANGTYISDMAPKGGCVYSAGNVVLVTSTVTGCELAGTGSVAAEGGGVYAAGYLNLFSAAIIRNTVSSLAGGYAMGGGAVVVDTMVANYSSISDNIVNATALTHGGGLMIWGSYAKLSGSTVSNNRADYAAGVYAGTYGSLLKVVNSTISGNSAIQNAGVVVRSDLQVDNSTIAFNHDAGSSGAAGVYVAGGALTLYSSIVAANGNADGPSDLGGSASTMAGAHNIVVAHTLPVPPDTISSCPRLQPLAANGGRTRTHAPMHDSPAIDTGSNALNLPLDQRNGPRVIGVEADIGSVEWNGALDDRVFVNGVDGLCDQ